MVSIYLLVSQLFIVCYFFIFFKSSLFSIDVYMRLPFLSFSVYHINLSYVALLATFFLIDLATFSYYGRLFYWWWNWFKRAACGFYIEPHRLFTHDSFSMSWDGH